MSDLARLVLAELERDPSACVLAPKTTPKGYGRFYRDGEKVDAHRWAWEQVNGPIPSGFEIHHLCASRACMNVAHLVLLSRAEHHQLHRKTHCPKGHPYAGENLRVTAQGDRRCRACDREQKGLPELLPRPCAECGKEFMPKVRREACYCSKACWHRDYRRRKREATG